MLWTDAIFITSADLASVDGDIIPAAGSESITLDGINGICQRSIEDSGLFLMSKMMGFAGFLAGTTLSANHLQAVFNIGTPAVQRSRILPDNIVVSGPNATYWSPLKIWAVHKALAYFYNSAANRNMAQMDRYAAKRDNFKKAIKAEHWPLFQGLGMPVTYKPMPAPAAVQAHNAGTFTISQVAGAGVATGSYDVAITYIDQSVPANNESNPSAVVTLVLTSGHLIKADITKLVPPNGMGSPADISRCIITPLNASGWNVYVGLTGQTLYLQNATPIPIAIKTYTLAADPTSTLAAVGLGQYPDQYLTIPDLMNRA